IFGARGAGRNRPKASNWTVTGRGLARGSEWTRNHQIDGRERRVDLAWFGGFLSGISIARHEDLLPNRNFEEVVDWLDEFCAAFPDDQICHAAQKVAARLISPAGGPKLPKLPSEEERQAD